MKLFIQLLVVGVIGFVLFDVNSAVVSQCAYLFGWLLTRIPGKAWLALFEALPSIMFWVWIGDN
jgi:hypothetical protein